jgi:ABC-type Fe3+-hydroxamate transport system substrate-binding protein
MQFQSQPGGNGHKQALHFHRPPRRVVSLVPSLTESMFDLGLGDAVVGITDYCAHPADLLQGLPRLGSVQDPRLPDILALKPDLVLASWEDNTRQTVEALEAAKVPVWVTYPRTVQQALDVLWALAGIFQSQAASLRLKTLGLTLDWAVSAAAERKTQSYFCPLWFDQTQDGLNWWMTFNQDTYCHDLLRLLGGLNVFAERQRRYPLEADLGLAPPQDPGQADIRYPRVVLEEVRMAQPELILLPSEPFSFDEDHRQLLSDWLADTPAVQNGQLYLVDGSLITWPGTRLAHALRELPAILSGD